MTEEKIQKKNRPAYYNRSPEEIYEKFSSGRSGLTEAQAEENREKFGANHLEETKKKSLFAIFLDQFKDLLVIILIIAALISAATGEAASTVVILVVLIMNAILGTVQYVKAEKSLESLKKLSSPEAKVIRDGEVRVIPADELVCGDLITLEAGDIIPGDGRITEAHALKTNESSLTGESTNAEKSADLIDREKVALGDQNNMVFSGSLVTYGRAQAVITAVGQDTELGQIAGLMQDTKRRKTPLQVSMDGFSKKLSIAIMIICVIVFALTVYRGMHLLDAMLFAVALAVAAIPEALTSIITISLAIGTKRMAEQNAIVKDLNAVEGLGCVSIICSDKTGTLTQNRMTVEYESLYDAAEGGDACIYAAAGTAEKTDPEARGLLTQRRMMRLASILCNDAKYDAEGNLLGDPTETAFIDYYVNTHSRRQYDELLDHYTRLAEVPFDSDRKLMSTVHLIEGHYYMFTKGALDIITARSANLDDAARKKIADENFRLSNEGLRVLSFAMKELPAGPDGNAPQITPADEDGFTYLGLLAEMDPPREESAQAVADCIGAGIKPIMITGDHKITASAIARRIGIMREGDLAFTGPEIDEMTDAQLDEKLPHISVYARVSPDNKIRIVKAWQKRGAICAMTGDGVNDGPALKSADVGVAMGITGTEVAKDSASMILTDDYFATIIKSVLNGRNIYANIKNAIRYLLSGNFSAILVVLFAALANLATPFTAVQLLFINLITDSLPALAISMEPSNPALIHDKPRSRDESVLDRETLFSIGFCGVLIAVGVAFAFLTGLGYFPAITGGIEGFQASAVTASTMAFATLCLARLFHGFNSRGRENIFRLGLFTNIYTIGAFVLGAVLLHCIVLLPIFKSAFGVAQLNSHLLGIVWLSAFLPSVVIQIVKTIRTRGEEK